MIGFASALEGLARSEAQFNQAARTIARAPLSTEATDTVDLSAAAVALLTALTPKSVVSADTASTK